jgi:hypothetical protein
MPQLPQYEKRDPPRPLPKAPYIVDPKLIPRILGIVDEQRNAGVLDDQSLPNIDDVIPELEGRFPEYKRKKKRAFRKSVEKCYAILRQDLGLPSSDSEIEAIDDDEDGPEILDEVYADLQKKSMNSSIANLYGTNGSGSSPKARSKKESVQPPRKKAKVSDNASEVEGGKLARKPGPWVN